MSASIGLVELISIPGGYEVADAMLNAAPVQLLRAQPACPGKFLIMVTGEVAAVRTALAAARAVGPKLLVCQAVDRLHPDVVQAMKSSARDTKIKAFGCVELRGALSTIEAADALAKAADVRLVRVRMAQGIGGKGYAIFTGGIAAVKSALSACEARFADRPREIVSSCCIASPHRDLIAHFTKGA